METKYNTDEQDTDRFNILKYFEFTMINGKSISKQVEERQIYVSKLKVLMVEVFQSLQVAAIILNCFQIGFQVYKWCSLFLGIKEANIYRSFNHGI